MSRFTQEEQANIIGIAAELEAAIIAENDELSRLKSQHFKSLPEVPRMESVPEPQYVKHVVPKAKVLSFTEYLRTKIRIPLTVLIILMAQFFVILLISTYVFSESGSPTVFDERYIIVAIISGVVAVLGLIALILFKKKHNKYVIKVRNSEEYKNECMIAAQATNQKNQQIKEFYDSRYRAAREEYDAAINNYNNVVVPEYNKELTLWKGNLSKMMTIVQRDLDENVDALNILYTTTQLIPSTYRTVERLTWLYEDMSTSEHDIERSIDLLNTKEIKEELVNIQVHIDDMRRDIRDGFVGVFSAIQEGNEIQSEMLNDLDRIRKSARAGNFLNVGGLIQNHKRNKTLSSINSKF